MSTVRDYLHRPAGEAVPSETPRVFGVEMVLSPRGLLYEMKLGSLEVSALLWEAVDGWLVSCGSGSSIGPMPLVEVGSYIEAELTRIESEIRAAREGKK